MNAPYTVDALPGKSWASWLAAVKAARPLASVVRDSSGKIIWSGVLL